MHVRTPDRPRVLFVCVQNSCRSQMAEALLRRLGGYSVEAWSAGSRPAARLHPGAVEVMRESGIDLSGQRPKPLEALPRSPFDVVVTLGCGDDACPSVTARRRVDWGIPDPADMTVEELRLVRDHLAARIRALLMDLARDRAEAELAECIRRDLALVPSAAAC
jgi:protein-tyrosine-phosphatase